MTLGLTEWLAIWGAVLSTALAILKVVEYRRDRALVTVRMSPNMKAWPATTPYGNMTLLLVNVVNAGRRPVSITHVWLRLPKSPTHLLCGDPHSAKYPVELTEGKHHGFVFNEDELKEKHGLSERDYIACAADSTGREYWSHGPLTRLWRLGRLR